MPDKFQTDMTPAVSYASRKGPSVIPSPESTGPSKVVAAVTGGSTSEKLTPEQIKNWRGVLSMTIGPYAHLMPDADVQKYRDRLQSKINRGSNTKGSRAEERE